MSEMNEMHDRALEEKIRALEEKLRALEEANRAGKSSKRIHARDCMSHTVYVTNINIV
jgi:hypothetical protein